MIDSQLRTSGVNQPWVLNAMASVAREQFVPDAMRDAAYIDRAIPSNRRIPFDPNYMQAAFALGQVKGRAGAWEAGPPIGTGFLEAK